MMQAYLDDKVEGRTTGLFVTGLMAGATVLGLLVAAMVSWGWMPLGERANIPRWSEGLNTYEQIVAVASLLYALCAARTTYGLINRERASLRWAQWMFFVSLFLGGIILLSVIIPVGLKFSLLLGQNIDVRMQINEELGGLGLRLARGRRGLDQRQPAGICLARLVGAFCLFDPALGIAASGRGRSSCRRAATALDSSHRPHLRHRHIFVLIAGLYVVPLHGGITKIRDIEEHRLLAGLLIFLPALFGYRQVRQVQEEADELRRAVALTPASLSAPNWPNHPSAGAIIGFIAIFMAFTMATDLFLEPSSIASFLSNVATKGVIAIGVTYLMISGEFDLSVGSILGVTALSFMLFMTEGAPVLVFSIRFPLRSWPYSSPWYSARSTASCLSRLAFRPL